MNLFEKYNIFFSDAEEYIKSLNDCNTFFIVDSKLKALYSFIEKLFPIHFIDADEKNKNLNELINIFNKLYNHNVDKSYQIIIIGGGLVCDIGSLSSNLWYRGIKYTLIPTTLLSMTDAAIGGKSAINYLNKKNLIGIISLPNNIVIDLKFINTLPIEEYNNGLAEIFKHGIGLEKKLFFNLIENKGIVNENILYDSILCKLKIIDEDLYEKNKRKLLNLGHTIGHAIEMCYNIKHGYAVAIGLMHELKISLNLGITSYNVYKEIVNQLSNYFNLNFNLDKETIINHILFDKKKKADTIDIPVVTDIGKSKIISINIDEYLRNWK